MLEPLNPQSFRLVYKRCRVLKSVAALAEFLGLLFPYNPRVGFVTVETVKLCLCHMEVVLPYLRLAPVAVFETVGTRRLDFAVRMMTIKASQR